MLSSDLYQISEDTANSKDQISALQEVHRPITFENRGYKTRISHVFELTDYIDLHQKPRFEPYMDELCGLSNEEVDLFLSAANKLISFQRCIFQFDTAVVPFGNLLAHLALYKKISGFGNFGRVLEVGPGAGNLALFMNADNLNNHYCQIETTQVLYLLQSHLNSFLYGEDFTEFAHPGHLLAAQSGFGSEEFCLTFNPSKRTKTMEHVPWWETAQFEREKFDVVTMNANLCEFSSVALDFYLDLAFRNLKEEGVFVVQCVGEVKLPGETGRPTFNEMIQAIIQNNFSIQYFCFDYKNGGRHTVENMVLVKKGNSSFMPNRIDGNVTLPIEQEDNELFSNYYRDKDQKNRRHYSKDELMELLRGKYGHIS